MAEIVEQIVFERTCRTCLEQDTNQEFLPLFNGSRSCKLTHPQVLEEVLFFNLGLWENDGLPQQMCLNCVDIFTSCSEFRRQCNDTQDKLASYHALGRVNAEKVDVKIEKIEFIDVDYDEKSSIDNEDTLSSAVDNSKDNDDHAEYLIETLNNEESEEIVDDAVQCENSNNKVEKYTFSTKFCKFCKEKFPRNISRNDHIKVCPDRNVELCEYCTVEFKTTAMLEEHLEEIHKDNKDPMCPICHRTFRSYNYRNAHAITYHSGLPEKYECNTCKGLFGNRNSLRNHILCYHKPTKYQCTICQQLLPNIFRYRYHMKAHRLEKNYKCQYCDKTFIQIGLKRDHELIHTGSHSCNFCGKSFKYARYLRHHIERYHDLNKNSALDNKENEQVDEIQSKNNDEENGEANVVAQRKYFVCKYCKKRFFRTKIESHTKICPKRDSPICELCTDEFDSAEKLEIHLKDIHEDDKRPSCNICYRKFASEAYRRVHVRAYHTERQFICKICSRVLRTKYGLWRHMQRVHSETKYQCSLCPKQLNNVFQYRYHMKAHKPKRKFQCQYCDKSFMQLRHKQDHENVHTDERPHLCNVCGKGYRTDQQLLSHIDRFHNSGEKKTTKSKKKTSKISQPYPFNCTLCSKGFPVSFALTRHLKTHTDKERKHVCEQCGQAFKRTVHLNLHVQRVHLKLKTITCDFCDKLFMNNGEKRAHMVTHKDEKPFKCPYCPNSFKWKNTLVIHERSHTGEKPFQCELCQKRFASHSSLSHHTITDHSEAQKKSLQENILQGFMNTQNHHVEIDVES